MTEIIQFEDKHLAHFAYAVISGDEMAVIDPARDPQPYYDLAKKYGATIKAVIETHPHADFISSHKEIQAHTGATIYVSKLLGAEYTHQFFDEGDTIQIGKVSLHAINTPGHSPDSICILLVNEQGKKEAVFTGDTLFIGDCGRPDLRETAGAITSERKELAANMYHSLRDKLMVLPDDVIVYPAHGAGSLCGKGLSKANSSTIGQEKATNWSLQPASEQDFINELLDNQPFVPKYFVHSVELNKKGAPNVADALNKIVVSEELPAGISDALIIDTRDESIFKKGHLPGAINLMDDTKFETWLGSVVSPGEKFYLVADTRQRTNELLQRISKIGYEGQVLKAFASGQAGDVTEDKIDLEAFQRTPDDYTIVDIRNRSEVKNKKVFDNAIEIPLPELRERVLEIPSGKPVVVHCAGGYRSAAGAAIIKQALQGDNVPVYDLSYDIKKF